MDNEESIRKFIRGTRFLWPLWTGPTLQKPRKKPLEISGLEIDPLEPIWVSYRLAYELLIIPLSQGVIDRDFIEIPHEKVDSYLLKRIYNAQSSVDPTIRKILGKEKLFYYMIENPDALIEILNEQSIEATTHEGKPTKGIKIMPESRMAIKDGNKYYITPNQLKVIQALEDAYNRQEPWMKWETIREKSRISANKMYDVFRRNKEAKNALIMYNLKNRLYRLNI